MLLALHIVPRDYQTVPHTPHRILDIDRLPIEKTVDFFTCFWMKCGVHQMFSLPYLILADISQLSSLIFLHLLLGSIQLCVRGREVKGVGGDEEVPGPAPVGALVIARRVEIDLWR